MPIRDGCTNVPIVRKNDAELGHRYRSSAQVRAPTVFWRGEKRRERDVTMAKIERRVRLDPVAPLRRCRQGFHGRQPLFRGVRAIMYNSPEERAMIQAVSRNHDVPSVVVGIGSEVPQNPQAARFRQKYNIRGPFAVYVGRIDENKGCKQLFEFFNSYLRQDEGRLSLVLIGHSLLTIPTHVRIRHLGFLDDTDKFDAMAAADLLIMPSYYESLSMVALEAWALGKPVLANGK